MGKREIPPAGRPALRVAGGRKVIHLPPGYPIHWPEPEPGRTFADVVKAIPIVEEMYDEVAHAVVLDFIQQGVPRWLDADDVRHASAVLLELCRAYPDRSPLELLWSLAADAFRPAPEGRPATRVGQDGRELYELVEAGLLAMNVRRDRRKGVRAVIAVLRENDPSGYGSAPEERLRKAYYDARRARRSVRKPR